MHAGLHREAGHLEVEIVGEGTDNPFVLAHNGRHRRFLPNIQKASLRSDALKRDVNLDVCTRALRTVQKKGGLDSFLLETDDRKLPIEALRLKRSVKRALSGA